MNRAVVINVVRFVFLVLVQALILRRINIEWENFGFIHIFIYPLFIILMPLKTPRLLTLFLGFAMGVIIDIFYDSLGIHASALVFTAYIRAIILKVLEPYGGYNVDDSPTMTTFGIGWWMTYAAILFFLHIFFYFSVEAFSFVHIFGIVMNTIFSFTVSIVIVFILQLILRPKY